MLILIRNVANCAKRCYGEGSRQVMEKKENGKNYSKKAMDLGNNRCKHYTTHGTHTLHDKMFPKAENVSYNALLSILLSRFLMNTLPTPDLRNDGSRCDHMIRIGRPLIVSKFIVSRARSAAKEFVIY